MCSLSQSASDFCVSPDTYVTRVTKENAVINQGIHRRKLFIIFFFLLYFYYLLFHVFIWPNNCIMILMLMSIHVISNIVYGDNMTDADLFLTSDTGIDTHFYLTVSKHEPLQWHLWASWSCQAAVFEAVVSPNLMPWWKCSVSFSVRLPLSTQPVITFGAWSGARLHFLGGSSPCHAAAASYMHRRSDTTNYMTPSHTIDAEYVRTPTVQPPHNPAGFSRSASLDVNSGSQ